MKAGLRVIAVVPARGGDPEVPYLNIKRLGALPLIVHTLQEAKKSNYLDHVVVSTDDDHVEQVALEYDRNAEVVRRPEALSHDVSEIRDVIRHAVETAESKPNTPRFDVVVTLQATSPFRRAEQIDAALDELIDNDFDAVISLKEVRTLTWHRPEGKLEPLFERPGRRDELEPLYHEDGAIRAVKRDVLASDQRLGEKVGHILMDKMSALTVRDIYDFWLAEKLVHLPRVLFCVDGGAEMGMGHVYRSVAVAKELTQIVPHADVCFLMQADLPEGVQHISSEGYPIRVAPGKDVQTVIGVIRDYSPNIIINDRPFLEDNYLRALAGLGASTINLVDSLDDIEKPSELASIIIATMQEGEVELDDYHAGPAFAILRDSFRAKAGETPAIPDEGRKIVMSFGGSDPQNLTMKALAALDELPELAVTVVLGPAYGYRAELDALVATLSTKPEILKNVEHMADILFEADLVLCSGGMTVFEIAALGRPGIVLCQNTRERERMEKFAHYGTILHLGLGTEASDETIRDKARALVSDRDKRQRMSDAGARLVDAQGTSRVYEVMKKAGNKGPANGGRWL
jgi:spore coat polysaccharide biosynthesis predicted glycosyltransferase SpsG/CMP-N-acetylneuraminic acid synthetase